jgi:Terpene cyclase DEP1
MINVTTQSRPASFALSKLYLVLAIFSLLISWGIFSQFLFSDGASIATFFQQAFASPIATLISSDILITAPIFWVFAYQELKRLGMPLSWLALYGVATSSVGICFALSLFLYQREVRLQRDQP